MKIKQTEAVKNLVKACYPEYKGRKFFIDTRIPNKLDSFWDSGSKDYFVFADSRTGKVLQVHSNHPAFEPNQPNTLNHLPAGMLLVKRSVFMGRECGITIYCNESDIYRFQIEEKKMIA